MIYSLFRRIAAYVHTRWDAACQEDAAAALRGGDGVAKLTADAALRHPLRVLVHANVTRDASPHLCTFAQAGLQIEVGPVPQASPSVPLLLLWSPFLCWGAASPPASPPDPPPPPLSPPSPPRESPCCCCGSGVCRLLDSHRFLGSERPPSGMPCTVRTF